MGETRIRLRSGLANLQPAGRGLDREDSAGAMGCRSPAADRAEKLVVGTEEWLFDELETFAGEGVYGSSDFPHTLHELLEYQAIAHEPFLRLGLGLADYREIPAEHFLYRYDASVWDQDNNVLVQGLD